MSRRPGSFAAPMFTVHFIRLVASVSVMLLSLGTVAFAEDDDDDDDGVLVQAQRFSGAGLFLDENYSDIIQQLRGSPGDSQSRSLVEFGDAGPPSDRCAGFDFEVPIVGGSVVSTLDDDLSVLNGILMSGFNCSTFDGVQRGRFEGVYVGGTRRFEGATGSFSGEFEARVLNRGFPASGSITGFATGTIRLRSGAEEEDDDD